MTGISVKNPQSPQDRDPVLYPPLQIEPFLFSREQPKSRKNRFNAHIRRQWHYPTLGVDFYHLHLHHFLCACTGRKIRLHSQNRSSRQIASAGIHRKTAVWKRLWDSCSGIGVFKPARRPFAGGCEAVVLHTVRQPCGGGCETENLFPVRRRPSDGCFQIGIRRSILAEGVSRYIRSTQCR